MEVNRSCKSVLSLLVFVLLFFNPTFCMTTCETSQCRHGQSVTVTCFFDTDLIATRRDFSIDIYRTDLSGNHVGLNIVQCHWLDDNTPDCSVSEGVEFRFDFNVPVRQQILIYNMTSDLQGQVACNTVPSQPETIRMCKLEIENHGISTSSGDLDLQQDRTAVRHDRTGEWSVQLTCGHFTSLGHPPVDVVWTTPTGETKQSTYYNDGNFHLILPNLVKRGNYSCAIAPQAPAASCLPGSSPLLRKAVVNVDEYGARLSLLEARQSETYANQSSYIHHLEDRDANLTRQIHSLTSQVQRLQEESVCREMNYRVLNEDWRDTSYSATTGHCDKHLTAGWYRFKLNGANAVIPTSCVQEVHCGTTGPLWLDLQGQSLPGVGQEVQARSCVSWKGNCCVSEYSKPVTVRNCGTFYFYNLQPVPTCYLAYCTTSH